MTTPGTRRADWSRWVYSGPLPPDSFLCSVHADQSAPKSSLKRRDKPLLIVWIPQFNNVHRRHSANRRTWYTPSEALLSRYHGVSIDFVQADQRRPRPGPPSALQAPIDSRDICRCVQYFAPPVSVLIAARTARFTVPLGLSRLV